MAGTATELPVIAPDAAHPIAVRSRIAGMLAPSLGDFFFLAVLLWLFMAGEHGWSSLLADGDTGWHIRAGEYILRQGHVPHQDLFSFSKAGQPWFAWEWLSDVIFAVIYDAFGFRGIVLLAGGLIGLFAALLLRYSLWRGANSFVALAVTLVGCGASTIHFLARPHLFTLVLFVAAVWLLEADRRRPTRAVWLLPLMTVFWTNLHGGFVILLVWLAVLAAGAAVEGACDGSGFARTRRYVSLLAACSAATLINPYGYHLHEHLISYLGADWIRNMVQEFQAPVFRGESQMQFELLLIAALVLVGVLLARRDFTAALTVVVFAHLALTSARHIPLFVIVAGPVVAAEVTRLWDQAFAWRPRSSIAGILDQLANDVTPKLRRASVLGPVTLAVLLLVPVGVSWPEDFAQELFPIRIARAHADILRSGRLFTTDQWADYLIFHSWPQARVFLDGRTDFYGKELSTEYVQLLHGEPKWQSVLARYGFTVVLVPPEMPLASLLRQEPDWRVISEDKKAVLLVRSGQGVSPGNLSGLSAPGTTGLFVTPQRLAGTGDGTQPNENLPVNRNITQETNPS